MVWLRTWPVTSTEAKVAEQGSAAHSDTAPTEKPGGLQEDLAESKTATPPGEEGLKKEDGTTLSSTETKSEKIGHDTADQITSASSPAHTQTVHTSSISKDANDNVSSAIDNDAFDQNGMGEITILPPASHVLDITEEYSTQSNTVAEEVTDNQNPSSATNTKVKDVPASKGEDGLNAEGTLTDNKEPLSNTPSSPPKSTASTGSTQSISSTVVEPPTSPQSSTSSTELSPPVTSIPNFAESKQTVADSNTSNKKAEDGMEEEVTKVAEKVGELDLEQRG
ncbi:MAG: hypothetical protein J3Q66DRAFT_147488 [Benniella sp.]|nr:MAG: hypothetical protein J3Q66DRAFT_147488 [Benniella sp.]